MDTETDALRRAAPSWSLADDKRLLDALQKMHDTLLTKCHDTSGQLSTMCNGLTDAALSLDNVNNRFMSLSNSQFVERRVYDDDGDVTAPVDDITTQKSTEQQPAAAESTAQNIKRALKVLENMHESVVILADSDSDSGSEGDDVIDRVVLKPKDVYRDRPLPHIIGTKAWKSKWHAGVLPDDSASESEDTDASRHFDQYSDNERYSPESDVKQGVPPAMRDRMSTSSSEVTSERDVPTPAAAAAPRSLPVPTMSPADIAAELARRLQGQPTLQQPPQPAMEESPPQQVPRKLYKPEKPPPGTIFPDEPPPLDSSDHEDDIFAELRKNKPYTHSDRAHNSVAKDLFGVRGTDDIDSGSEEDGDIFSDLVPGVNKSLPTAVKQHVTISVKPHPIVAEPSSPVTSVVKPENKQLSNKKPVGGISVFGGGQHSAIGAAILQRQRQTASGDDTDGSDVISAPKQAANKPETQEESVNAEENTHKDIFEDLFAKSERVNAKRKVVKEPIVKESVVTKKEKKVDLFSDNLFDDIDDIFTSTIVSKVPIKEAATKNSEKSIFDDEDDLFRDIAVSNTSANQAKVTAENKTIVKEKTANIFDIDDDLFSDKPLLKRDQDPNKVINTQKDTVIKTGSIDDNTSIISKDTISNTIKSTKSIFDSDEDLFVENKPTTKLAEVAKDIKTTHVSNEPKSIFDESDDDIFSDIKVVKNKEITTNMQTDFGAESKMISSAKNIKDKSIFEDSNNLFKEKSANIKTEQIKIEKKDLFSEEDKLFISSTKTEIQENIADVDKTYSKEIIGNQKLLVDKSLVATNKSVEDILYSDDVENKESDSSRADDNIPVLNESEYLKLDTKDDKEILSGIHKTSTEDKVRTNNENVTVNSENTESKVSVQFDDDDNIFKTVIATAKKIPIVTPKDIKSEISHKPTLKTDREETTNNKTKEKFVSVNEKVDNAKICDDRVDNMKAVDSNKNVTSDKIISTPDTTPSDSKLNTPNIFSEILNDQPPIFEKPKEPKRSKNVNALFDDDSDDEALFYRKSDATLHDVPSLEKKDSLSDDRFQLFLDEPPAIDEDLEQNTNKKIIESSLEHSDLFEDVSVSKSDDGFIETSQSLKQLTDETDHKNKENVNKLASKIFDDNLEFKSKETNDTDDESVSPKPKRVEVEQINIKAKDNQETKDNQEQTTVTKKVGKLKPMNLNINVTSLLPGASPKKTAKIQEQIDGQQISTNTTEDLHSKLTIDDKEIQPSLVKSVSFDEDPDSTILDNKLSKDRAKIKVKRRPSSRRARHEAARISGIDFGQDSIDNSSSIDDIIKSTDTTDNSQTTTDNKGNNIDSITCDSLTEDSKFAIRENNIIREKYINKVKIANKNTNNTVNNDNDDNKQIDNNVKITKDSLIKPESIPHVTPSKEVKSKVVYIINDEDIFNNAQQHKSSEIVTKPTILNIVDDDDDIFKSITPATNVENAEAKTESPPIKTLGNVYKAQTEDSDDDIFKDKQNVKKVSKLKEAKQDLEKLEGKTDGNKSKQETDTKTKAKTSIFDNLSDEENELFNKKQKVTLPENKLNKKVIFDSDSDSELFSGKSKKEKGDTGGVAEKEKGDTGAVAKKEIKRVEVKGSLFGDYDDDDLFGANSKKTASSVVSSSTSLRNESAGQPQGTSNDPLSALLKPK